MRCLLRIIDLKNIKILAKAKLIAFLIPPAEAGGNSKQEAIQSISK